MHATTQTNDRWGNWMGRARTCFKVAAAIDTAAPALAATARQLELSTHDDLAREAACALREAEAALIRAREAVHAALQAKKLTPANRQASFGLH
jgi:hypothetical protein